MFFVKNMDREVTIHPSYFNSDASRIVLDRLRSDIEGTIEGTLMVIRIVDVEEVSEPKLQPGTGMAVYHLHYRAIVWRPYRGEVVDGLVSSVVNNGFFVDVGALSVFVSKAMIPQSLKYSVEGSTPQFTDNVDQSVERGTQVRLRIKGIRGEMGSMYAIGSIREDYLGMSEGWATLEANEEEAEPEATATRTHAMAFSPWYGPSPATNCLGKVLKAAKRR